MVDRSPLVQTFSPYEAVILTHPTPARDRRPGQGRGPRKEAVLLAGPADGGRPVDVPRAALEADARRRGRAEEVVGDRPLLLAEALVQGLRLGLHVAVG